MIWRDLPPAGEPVLLEIETDAVAEFADYCVTSVNSGTAALALSLLAARRLNPAVEHPEAVLPAYGCPDLVAAARFAGVVPVLADIAHDDPGFDLPSVQRVLSPRTIAVVAINFLGIRERLADLRILLQGHSNAVLIEDNAQWFPARPEELVGDAVCLSFGRGKPVSLLGGGALLLRGALAQVDLAAAVAPQAEPGATLRLRFQAYNLLLRPFFYGLLSRNPFLHLGRTVFKPLHTVAALDSRRSALLMPNIRAHLDRDSAAARRIDEFLPAELNLPARLRARAGRLLRYPVLCADGRQRDDLLQRLRRAGLGATAMYRRPLPEIEGVGLVGQPSFPGAQLFADRLLTLPTHSGVDAGSLVRMEAIFRRVAGSRGGS
jgi:dTDP-4-amino-4,6-dideoxygalactose transaminase